MRRPLTPSDPAQEATIQIERLKDPSPGIRLDAIHQLGYLVPTKRIVEAFARSLNDDDAEVRRWSAVGLISAGSEGRHVVPQLIEALDHTDQTVRVRAVGALCMIGPPAKDALPRLKQMRTTNDKKLREWVLTAIGAISAS